MILIVTPRAVEGASREGWYTPLLYGCRILPNLMLFNKTIKTLSVVALSLGALAPTPSQAATCSYASHYGVGDGYNGQRTASGERFNAYGNSAAHRYLPFGTRLQVTNESNGKSVIIRINDRGPYVAGRNLDLSYGAFSAIASPSRGEIRVCYSQI